MWLGALAGTGVITTISYVLVPFLAWIVAGASKFIINSISSKQLAFELVGYGGLPSNHSAIVSSMAAFIAFKEGGGNFSFGVAITLALLLFLMLPVFVGK